MYKGGLRFPKENLQLELLEAAKALKMEECQGAVRAWFASYLTPEEAIRIAPIALKKGHIQTFDICCTIISTVASSLLDYHPHILLNSELPMLIHFVKSSYYDVSENALFKLVTDYCERNAEKYGSDPKTFFKTHFENLIRYPLMKPEEIYSNFNSTNYYSSWVDRKFILEAYKFNALGRVYRDGLSTLRTIPRENISTIKWQAPSTCKNMLKFEKNKVTKISGGNYWNCVAYIPLKRSKYITVKIDFTNNDRSGLAIGIGGIDLIDKLSSYSDIVSTQYNMPSGATLGNPPIGSKIGYIVDYSKNEIRVIENGIDVGASHKKPSIFGKDLVLIAFLYYEQNSVSIIKNPRKKK